MVIHVNKGQNLFDIKEYMQVRNLISMKSVNEDLMSKATWGHMVTHVNEGHNFVWHSGKHISVTSMNKDLM